MNTPEGNKLIAKFMGFHEIMLDEESKYDIGDIYEILGIDITAMGTIEEDQLEFHTSWEWLMPVVEKIQKMGYSVHMNEVSTNINNNTGGTKLRLYFRCGYNSSHGDMKKRTYKAVVEFIKWYNENL